MDVTPGQANGLDCKGSRIQATGRRRNPVGWSRGALVEVGIPGDWLADARFAGPLAMFEGADS